MRRLLPALALLLPGCVAEAREPLPRWHAAAAQPMNMLRSPEVADATCRQVLRVTAAGPRVRVRLSNVLSKARLSLTAATAGLRATAAAARPDSLQPLTVGGQASFVIPSGRRSSATRCCSRSWPGTRCWSASRSPGHPA